MLKKQETADGGFLFFPKFVLAIPSLSCYYGISKP